MSVALRTLVVCALCAATGTARADAIGIPADMHCPEGTSLTANHAGHWCEVRLACAADAECRDDELCTPDAVAVCVGIETYTMGARLATDHPSTRSIRVGRGPCDASCVAPGTCETARRCVPRPPAPVPAEIAPPPAPTTTGGCVVSTGARASALLASCAIGLALVLRRRRAR